ncbi:hypothetical protein ABDC18_002864 [Escherichia coli]
MSNPNPVTPRFQKGNQMAKLKKGMKYNVKNEIVNFISTIPVGMKPWERMYQIANTEEVSVDIHYKANKTLGDWGLENVQDNNVHIHADNISVDTIDDVILSKLGYATSTGSEGEAFTNDEEKTIHTE